MKIETVYFGGGTPTAVNNEEFENIMKEVYNAFIKDKNTLEFTVECGRPDDLLQLEELETKNMDTGAKNKHIILNHVK